MTSINRVSVVITDTDGTKSPMKIPVTNMTPSDSVRGNYVVLALDSQKHSTYARVADLVEQITNHRTYGSSNGRFEEKEPLRKIVQERIQALADSSQEITAAHINEIYLDAAHTVRNPTANKRKMIRREEEEKIKKEEERNESPPPKQPELKKSKSTETAAAVSEDEDALSVLPAEMFTSLQTQPQADTTQTNAASAASNTQTQVVLDRNEELYQNLIRTMSAAQQIEAPTIKMSPQEEPRIDHPFESLAQNHTSTVTVVPSSSFVTSGSSTILSATTTASTASKAPTASKNDELKIALRAMGINTDAFTDTEITTIASVYDQDSSIKANWETDMKLKKPQLLTLLLHKVHNGDAQSFLSKFNEYYIRLVDAPNTQALEPFLKSHEALVKSGGLIRRSARDSKFYVCTSTSSDGQHMLTADSFAPKAEEGPQ